MSTALRGSWKDGCLCLQNCHESPDMILLKQELRLYSWPFGDFLKARDTGLPLSNLVLLAFSILVSSLKCFIIQKEYSWIYFTQSENIFSLM